MWDYDQEWGDSPDIVGFHVEATDGRIGSVDEASWDVGQSLIVVDTGPWIFGKKVMLPAGLIATIDSANKSVQVGCSKDQVKNSPEYDDSMRNDSDYRGSLGSYYDGPRM